MATLSRRQLLTAGGAAVGAAALGVSLAGSAEAAAPAEASRSGRRVHEETKSLDQLSADAKREGAKLSFTPAVTVEEAGALRDYKPAGFSKVYPGFRDRDGAWVAIGVYAFSFMYHETLGQAPASPRELIDPRWKNSIASSFRHGDDAVLYLFRLYAKEYGWDWVRRFAEQNPQFARGSHSPIVAVASKQKPIGVGGAGSLIGTIAPGVKWVAPDGHPSWRGASVLGCSQGPSSPLLPSCT